MKKPTRREFLSYSAATVGAIGVAAVPLSREPFYRQKFNYVEENHVELPANGKTVCILGGGLGGLQAGVELAARGFKIEILEKSGVPGGKLKSWRDRSFGPPDHPLKKDPNFKGFPKEHGIHAIWGHYNNLREFMGRYGMQLLDLPDRTSIFTFVDKDKTLSYIPKTTWPAPYNRLQQLYSFMNLNLLEKGEELPLLKVMQKLFTFDYADKAQRDYLDSMTLEEYCKKVGLSDASIYKLIDSVVEMAFFDSVKVCSAAVFAQLMQLIAGAPEDMLEVNFFANPPIETFLQPMVDYILKKGGTVHYNTEVTHLNRNPDRIQSVFTTQLIGARLRRCQICGELIYGDDPHEVCPFCAAEGTQLKDLNDSEKSEREFHADYFIMAMDTPGMQKLISTNIKSFGEHPYFQNILGLHSREVFIVNFWVEGRKHWTKLLPIKEATPPNFFGTSFDYVGLTANWATPLRDEKTGKISTIVKEYEEYDVSIIETQIAKIHNVELLSNQEMADRCYEELKGIMPELPPYQSSYVNKWRTYTRWLPGDEGRRPPIQSPIDNLLFIGDMVFIPMPSMFMEKTNVTAKWATNILLDKIGQKEGKIKILMSGTPSAIVSALKTVASVYV
ncbi:FAD-dependent oxidoreductase [Deltaproteobacteria bacterium TL4]